MARAARVNAQRKMAEGKTKNSVLKKSGAENKAYLEKQHRRNIKHAVASNHRGENKAS